LASSTREIPKGPFLSILDSIKSKQTQQKVVDLMNQLKNLPENLKKRDFEPLIERTENEYKKRIQYFEYLLLDKIELLQAIEQHKKLQLELSEGNAHYSSMFDNAKRLSANPSFQEWKDFQNEYIERARSQTTH
jgi:hypothetical protein